MTATDPTPTEKKPKTRTDYESELARVCDLYAIKTGRLILAQRIIYPSQIYSVRVDESMPFTFKDAKTAAIRVQGWVDAP